MKAKSSIKYFIILSLLFMLSCSEQTEYVTIKGGNGSEANDSNFVIVKIKPYIKYILSQSRSSSESTILGDKDYIHIYICDKGKDLERGDGWNYMGVYKMKKNTALPVFDYIKLYPGTYDVYAVSILNESNNIIPDIDPTNGYSKYLYNGEDYLWSKKTSVEVLKNDSCDIELNLEHTCVQLDFNFVNNVNSLKLISMTVTGANSNDSKLNISSGLISLSTVSDTNISKEITNNGSRIIMLPLAVQDPLKLTLQVEDNNVKKNIVYSIPTPQGEVYQGGYNYNYKVDLTNGNVTLQ